MDDRVSAQVAEDSAVAAFLDRVHRATARYRDHSEAVAAGYRWMGPDMPNMGEHWINPRLVVHPSFDPMRPSCLSYIRVGQKRVLTGIAYIVPVPVDASPPSLPVSAGTWHYHTSTLDEEAFTASDAHHHGSSRPGHAHSPAGDGPDTPHGMSGKAREGLRLAMMHVWAWSPNPDGPFEADNWGLSYARLGLPLPDTIRPDASKALFLMADAGIEYYESVLRVNASPTAEERAALRSILQRSRQGVRRIVDDTPAGMSPRRSLLSALWWSTWNDVRSHLRPEVWEAIEGVVISPTP